MSLKGIFCPVVTPFTGGGIAVDGFRRNIDFWTSTGLSGYVVLGSTGEAALLAESERAALIQLARECAPDQSLIVGTGCEATEATIRSTKAAADLGADYALVITPSYFKAQMTPDCLRAHFLAVADESPVPVIVYNVPKFTDLDISPDVVADLARHENICGMKESADDLVKLATLSGNISPEFELLIGNARVFLAGLSAGAGGAILALCNFAASECVEVYNLVRRQSYNEAREIFLRLLPLATAIVGKHGVPGIKAAMDIRGQCGGEPRRPLLPPAAKVKLEIEGLLREAELL